MILILIFNISHKQHPYPTTYSQASSTYVFPRFISEEFGRLQLRNLLTLTWQHFSVSQEVLLESQQFHVDN